MLFDRSWYNRAGVERVMGFCTDEEYQDFLRSCPGFERMLVQSGIILIKYWFAISPEEQERRFKSRLADPRKRWKIGPIDIASRAHWLDYSRAKDEMFKHTDTDEAPWYLVGADIKRHARLNCIHHLLQTIPCQEIPDEQVELPDLQKDPSYRRPHVDSMTWVPEVYGSGASDAERDSGEG